MRHEGGRGGKGSRKEEGEGRGIVEDEDEDDEQALFSLTDFCPAYAAPAARSSNAPRSFFGLIAKASILLPLPLDLLKLMYLSGHTWDISDTLNRIFPRSTPPPSDLHQPLTQQWFPSSWSAVITLSPCSRPTLVSTHIHLASHRYPALHPLPPAYPGVPFPLHPSHLQSITLPNTHHSLFSTLMVMMFFRPSLRVHPPS